MGIKAKHRKKIKGSSSGSQGSSLFLHKPTHCLCWSSMLELQPSWQRGKGTVGADGDVNPFAEVKDANVARLKWGCLDRCILSLPIFLLLKQKELRVAKIQKTSKSFSFYFPCKGNYLKSGICRLSALALGLGKCWCNDRSTCTEVPGHWPPWITGLDGTVGAHPALQKTQVSSES